MSFIRAHFRSAWDWDGASRESSSAPMPGMKHGSPNGKNPRQPSGTPLRPAARGRAIAGGVQRTTRGMGSHSIAAIRPGTWPSDRLRLPAALAGRQGNADPPRWLCASPHRGRSKKKSAGLSTGFTPMVPTLNETSRRKGAQLPRANSSPVRRLRHQLGPDRHRKLKPTSALNLPQVKPPKLTRSASGFASNDRPSSPSQRQAVSSSASASRLTCCQPSKPTPPRAPDSRSPSKPCPPKSPNTSKT